MAPPRSPADRAFPKVERMKKLAGILVFFGLLYLALWQADPRAASMENHVNLAQRIGKFGILSLGAGILIISGGIDLSIGSVVGLAATVAAMMLNGQLPGLASVDSEGNLVRQPLSPWLVVPAVLLLGGLIGLLHGWLTARLRMQAFVVTLCGLFIYRGLARYLAGDSSQSAPVHDPSYLALKNLLYTGDVFGLPKFFVLFLILLAAATVFMHLSVHGRYLFAIGANETAARYSGIAVTRYKILAYVLCSMLAAFGGLLYLVEFDSVVPSEAGGFYELYAIAGAVLGGCSLRGGEGTIPGILVGAAILRLLPNLVNMWGVPSALEDTVIGGALLLGAMLDELLRRKGRS